MAETAGGAFRQIMEQMAYDLVVDEYVMLHRSILNPDTRPTEELRAEGRKIADRLRDSGKLMEFHASRVPPPCPTCGHTPGW